MSFKGFQGFSEVANYKNVQKRFITQLIDKGFYHHYWSTKIIAVVQDVIYEALLERIDFPEVAIARSNVIFMRYGMELTDTGEGERYKLRLKGVTGTTHNNLMMSSIYQRTPPKAEFCNRIIRGNLRKPLSRTFTAPFAALLCQKASP